MRKAFTLIELLAVIFIITLLVGILMPAVQGVREAARGTQCINNQRNLAVGLLNYEETQGKLPGWRDFIPVIPPSAGVTAPLGYQAGDEVLAQASWVFCILPYIEQTDLYDRLKTGQVDVSVAQIPSIAILHCPSHMEGPQGRATNYVVNTGAVDDFSDQDSNHAVGWNGVTTDGNVANGPFLDRVKIVAGMIPQASSCTCNENVRPCRYRPNAEKYRNAVARLVDISKMDGTAHTLLTSENCQRGYWISEQIVHFSTDREGENSPAVAANHWDQLSDGRWFVTPDSGAHTLEGAVGFCWPRFYAEPDSYVLCQIAYPRAMHNVAGNPYQGFTGAQNDLLATDPITGEFKSIFRTPYDKARIPIFPNMFNRKTSFETWYQSARPSSYHAGIFVASFCDGTVRKISTTGLRELVFVQLMVAGAAQSDAGWSFQPFGVLDRNFLEGQLFDPRSL